MEKGLEPFGITSAKLVEANTVHERLLQNHCMALAIDVMRTSEDKAKLFDGITTVYKLLAKYDYKPAEHLWPPSLLAKCGAAIEFQMAIKKRKFDLDAPKTESKS